MTFAIVFPASVSYSTSPPTEESQIKMSTVIFLSSLTSSLHCSIADLMLTLLTVPPSMKSPLPSQWKGGKTPGIEAEAKAALARSVIGVFFWSKIWKLPSFTLAVPIDTRL